MAEAAQIMEFPEESQYAGFWRRFLAVCIDLTLSAPLYYGMTYAARTYGWLGDTAFSGLLIVAYPLFFSSRWQATPGMYLMNFRITDGQGGRIAFGRGFYWILTSLIMWLICFAGVAYLQSRFDLYGIMQLLFSCHDQNIAQDDCQHEVEQVVNIPFGSFQALVHASLGLFVFLTFIWALSIALPKDKTGFHNLLCGTRFLKGRP
jgi:uncharacterized RDD family membrane protein YckC